MRIFLDTEFTTLTNDAELISVGMVTEHGQELYLERTDYDKSKESPFVKEVVIPLLDAPIDNKLTANECCNKIVDWLLSQDSEIILVSDSNYDAQLIHEIFAIHGGIRKFIPNLKYEMLFFDGDVLSMMFGLGYMDYFKANQNKEHHALHDARALCAGWKRMNGYY